MSRQPIAIPPGFRRRATSQATGRAWFDMSLVRWNGPDMQPVGGWLQLPAMQLNDAVRKIMSWRDNTATRWIGAASLGQVMVYDSAGHDITPSDFIAGVPGDLIDGYGIGAFGVGSYGTPRTPDLAFNPLGAPGDTLSVANWGENLVVCGSADERLLWWVPPDSSTGLVPIPPATPTAAETPGIVHVVPPARYAFVTDERFLVALGANHDPRQVAWSDQERPGAWTADIANLAGSLELNTTGIARTARKVPQGYLIYCDDDIHLMQFVGPPFGYGISRVGTGQSAIGPEAICATAARTVWMGQDTFWLWFGVAIPLACDIQEYIFTNINRNTQGRSFAAQNGLYPEIWFFYPDSSSVEPNRYAAWNYEQNIWIGGMMGRTSMCEPAAYGLPLMGDVNGFVYAHEQGWLANGEQMGGLVFAESGDIQLAQGDQGYCIRAIYPDFLNPEQVQIHLLGQWESEDVMEDFGIFPYTRTDGVIDALVEARTFKFRVEGVPQPTAMQSRVWQMGNPRWDIAPGAGR
jgi:hypothetical protein